MNNNESYTQPITDREFERIFKELSFEVDHDFGHVNIVLSGSNVAAFDMPTECFEDEHYFEFEPTYAQWARIEDRAMIEKSNYEYDLKREQPEPRYTRFASGIY